MRYGMKRATDDIGSQVYQKLGCAPAVFEGEAYQTKNQPTRTGLHYPGLRHTRQNSAVRHTRQNPDSHYMRASYVALGVRYDLLAIAFIRRICLKGPTRSGL
jgi:hypothetical protein